MTRRKLRRVCLYALLGAALVGVFVFRGQLAWLPNRLAAQAIRSSRIDDAQWWLGAGQFLASDNPRTELLRSRVDRKLGDFEQAKQHLQRASELGLSAVRLRVEETLIRAQAGEIQQTLPLVDQTLLLADSSDRAEVCEAFVQGLVKARINIRTAIDLCNLWVSEFPGDPRPHLALSKLALELMDLDTAVTELWRVLELEPHHGSGALALGDILQRKQEYEEAFRLFKLAARDEATRLDALARQAACLRHMGRLAAARTLLEETVLVEDPDSDVGNLEWARLEIEAGHHPAAIARLRELLGRSPNYLDARETLVLALSSVGQSEEARQQSLLVRQARTALVRAKQLIHKLLARPSDIEARLELGRINLEYGDPQLGLDWLQSALSFDPNHKATLMALVEFYDRTEESSIKSMRLASTYRERLAALEHGS